MADSYSQRPVEAAAAEQRDGDLTAIEAAMAAPNPHMSDMDLPSGLLEDGAN